MSWKSRRAIAKGAALVAIGIVIARSYTEWPMDESWIELGIAAVGAAVAIDPLTRRRVERSGQPSGAPGPRELQILTLGWWAIRPVLDDEPGRAFHTMAAMD